MEINEKVLACLYKVVDEVNLHLDSERRLGKSIDTRLFGDNSELDSLGLLSFGVAVEQKIEDEFGKAIVFDWEDIVAGEGGSFQTIGSLKDYIVSLLGGVENG